MDEHFPIDQSSFDSAKYAAGIGDGELNPHVQSQPTIPPGPLVPRWVAAAADNLIAVILSFVAAKSVSDHLPLLQGALFVGAYLGYFFLFEALFARTPGKIGAGLVVVDADGCRCGWHQSFVRTGFRLLEVNPVLLGAIPAALMIVFSKHRQRMGDLVANTLVVEAKRL